MIYIKLDKDSDKYIENKYKRIPKFFRKILIKLKKGKLILDKKENLEYVILPNMSQKNLKKLRNLSDIKCWKNVCVSDNLIENREFIDFAKEKSFVIMDGKWLFKNIVDKIVEYVADYKSEPLAMQEVSFFCNQADEIILENIKEIAIQVKICNILTDFPKQFKKLEEIIYKTNGIILNISNNYKRAAAKSSIVVNFDFSENELEQCFFKKNVFMIHLNKNIKINNKDSRNIISYKINLPEKYLKYPRIFEGFHSNILYESFIFRNTNYKNIRNQLQKDNIKIVNLEDANQKIMKSRSKTLDKIQI